MHFVQELIVVSYALEASVVSDVFMNLRIVYVCRSTGSVWSNFFAQWFSLELFVSEQCLHEYFCLNNVAFSKENLVSTQMIFVSYERSALLKTVEQHTKDTKIWWTNLKFLSAATFRGKALPYHCTEGETVQQTPNRIYSW